MNFDSATLLLLQKQALGDALAFQHRLQMMSRESELRSLVRPTPIDPSRATLSSYGLPTSVLYTDASSRAQMLQAILLREQVQRLLQQQRRAQHLELFKPLEQQFVGATPDFEAPNNPNILAENAKARLFAAVSPLADPDLVEENESALITATIPKPKQSVREGGSSVINENRLAAKAANKPLSAKKDIKWLASLEKLREYHARFGDCIVPRGYSLDPQLASWVAEQRKQYKLLQDGKPSSINPDRVALLNELAFSWNAQESAWSKHFEDLKRFRAKMGHCHVPLNHPEFPKLGLWVKEQRRHYTLLKQGKPSHMTSDRAEKLDEVGFCWDTHEATWLERFKELVAFKEETGHCLVPTNYPENPRLGTWVHHQRRQYKKFKEDSSCHITEPRIRALDSLGFVWSTRDKCEASTASSVSDDDQSNLDLRPGSLSFRPYKRPRLSSYEGV